MSSLEAHHDTTLAVASLLIRMSSRKKPCACRANRASLLGTHHSRTSTVAPFLMSMGSRRKHPCLSNQSHVITRGASCQDINCRTVPRADEFTQETPCVSRTNRVPSLDGASRVGHQLSRHSSCRWVHAGNTSPLSNQSRVIARDASQPDITMRSAHLPTTTHDGFHLASGHHRSDNCSTFQVSDRKQKRSPVTTQKRLAIRPAFTPHSPEAGRRHRRPAGRSPATSAVQARPPR